MLVSPRVATFARPCWRPPVDPSGGGEDARTKAAVPAPPVAQLGEPTWAPPPSQPALFLRYVANSFAFQKLALRPPALPRPALIVPEVLMLFREPEFLMPMFPLPERMLDAAGARVPGRCCRLPELKPPKPSGDHR